ncbi:cop9 signalosome complex subunit [Anaeramoeba flamelloides]|uniref:COP9 signalosome complex subunit 6 n=1 Tax=Anaeramoeba flamelloides TaxID=1746091 RepID=A0AAV7ZLE1_9EUKA|nr:cop9 signalosome complex subunit [Anaeramoeba flamelloides]
MTEETSTGALEIFLHPLVILNICDHFTRARVNSNKKNPRVIGAMIGTQNGRSVEIHNSFELVYTQEKSGDDQIITINKEYLEKKKNRFVEVYKNFEIMGWYSTGNKILKNDLKVHESLLEFNESPLYLQLDPNPKEDLKELPIKIYESELRIVNSKPKLVFLHSSYKTKSLEPERLAVDNITKFAGSSNDKASKLTTHVDPLHSAIEMLRDRLVIILKYLRMVAGGQIEGDQAILRLCYSLANKLPALNTEKFLKEYQSEYNDTLLTTYLVAITKGTDMISEVIDKFDIAFQKRKERRRFNRPYFMFH